MSSDSAETVKRPRELMDSGIDPMALMSQLAGLIMDIIAGTYKWADSSCCNGQWLVVEVVSTLNLVFPYGFNSLILCIPPSFYFFYHNCLINSSMLFSVSQNLLQ